MYLNRCVLCWVAAACYDGYFWGAKDKSFIWKRMLLVKNELDAPGDSQSWNGDLWKPWKNILLEKKRTLKKWQCNTLWILVEKYQYRNPEQNTIRVYFLIEKCVVLEDPSKQLNMRRLIGWDNTFRGNHINHITAGIGNSSSDFTLWWAALKKKGTPHNCSQWSYMVHWEFCWNEMSFWIWCILSEPWAKVNICTAEQKLSAHGSCATNHAWPRKSCLLIREACTHYSPVSSAGDTRLRNMLFTWR